MQEQAYLKDFKVVAVSSIANSFGLRGMVLMAKDGEAWEVGVNHLYIKEKNAIVSLPVKNGETQICCENFPCEIPRQLSKAPQKVVAEVWG